MVAADGLLSRVYPGGIGAPFAFQFLAQELAPRVPDDERVLSVACGYLDDRECMVVATSARLVFATAKAFGVAIDSVTLEAIRRFEVSSGEREVVDLEAPGRVLHLRLFPQAGGAEWSKKVRELREPATRPTFTPFRGVPGRPTGPAREP